MENFLLIVTGHGAGDPGACSNGYQEAERVRALAQRIKAFGGDAVLVSEPERNYYKDNGISKLTISKDYKILELHLDSSILPTPKGGHVIINGKFEADEYDKKLAELVGNMFPGRSKTIVGRTNLANCNRAAAKGYNYRLLECAFISNKDDITKFNENMDEFAKGILDCFGIKYEAEANTQHVEPAPTIQTTTQAKKSIEDIANEVIAGKWGNGSERKAKIVNAGYDYNAVQTKVNEILTGKSVTKPTTVVKTIMDVANEVIAGKWGSGSDRKNRLTAAGYNYSEVQAKVNEILGVKSTSTTSKKSNEEIAREVIAGKWGNGEARKKALTNAGYDYEVIRTIVNKLM